MLRTSSFYALYTTCTKIVGVAVKRHDPWAGSTNPDSTLRARGTTRAGRGLSPNPTRSPTPTPHSSSAPSWRPAMSRGVCTPRACRFRAAPWRVSAHPCPCWHASAPRRHGPPRRTQPRGLWTPCKHSRSPTCRHPCDLAGQHGAPPRQTFGTRTRHAASRSSPFGPQTASQSLPVGPGAAPSPRRHSAAARRAKTGSPWPGALPSGNACTPPP
mmetsp:Transcript_171380/g.549364  ORF Transcript_171380/g.549364 Transcript_171380/m.549364 type:complete len:214 (-) Transcript_171380:105-746(-)